MTLDIAALRKLLAEAQHLPWLCVANSKGENWMIANFGNGDDGNDYELTSDGVRCSESRGDAKADAELCAAAVNALPALLDAAEERDRLRSQRDALLAAAEVVGRYRNMPHIACGAAEGMECECGATDFNAALDAMNAAIAAAKEAS